MTRASAAVSAPAKINFGLRVVGRSPDGYHALDSIFLPLDLADELELAPTPGPGVELALSGAAEGVPADARNLAARAARAFAQAAGLAPEPGLQLRLRKSIPTAAGLGGGSSDAGAVLRSLAALHPGRVAPERLRALALELGADVPFFLDPRPARVTGVGERVEPLAGVPALWLLLASPGLPLATAEVYRAFDALAPALTPSDPAPTLRALRALGATGGGAARLPRGEFEAALRNDLEPAAARLCPPLSRLRKRLGALGALGVGLSGSGPTLFGVFPDRAAAERAGEALRPAAPEWVRVAQTLASP